MPINRVDHVNRLVRAFLTDYEQLRRKDTDETGWIALKFSCSRERAAELIANARATRSIGEER
jgi:hypothetical protein